MQRMKRIMSRLSILALLAASLAAVQGSTLQQLSLNDMILKSTLIVRGSPQLNYSQFRGAIIYTHYTIEVSQVYKGLVTTKQLDVAVPGGMTGGMRQVFSGVPGILNGGDYVFFLWTSKSGLTQIIGLSQGLFTVGKDSSGNFIVQRPAATETMLNVAGQPVNDSLLQMKLGDLLNDIYSVLKAAGQ